jgi:hypothetical protein
LGTHNLTFVAKEIPVGTISHLRRILITDTPHGTNDTQESSKLETGCKMHGPLLEALLDQMRVKQIEIQTVRQTAALTKVVV